MPPRVRVSFQLRLLGRLLILTLVMSLGAALLIYRSAEEGEREEAQAWMQATIVQVADRIDLARFPLDEPERLTEADRAALRAELTRAREALVREIDNAVGERVAARTLLDLAVLVPTDTREIVQVIAAVRPETIGEMHDLTTSPARRLAWRAVAVEDAPAPGARNRELHAYVPIRNAAGAPVAVLRIDADRGYFLDLLVEAALAVGVIFVVSTAAATYLTWRFARVMARPLRSLLEGMDAVAGGDFESRIAPPRTGDEFEAVAVRFNEMTGDLADRARIKRDIDAAAAVQQRLLPTEAPSCPGYEFFGRTRYCDEAGGDYFDFVRHGDAPDRRDPMGIVVADVSGHGLGAALRMTAMRAVLLSTFFETGGDVERTVDAVNVQSRRDSEDGGFVTMFLARLDVAAHTVTWASAGHDPALLYRAADDRVERLHATGLPLGVVNEPIPLGPVVGLGAGDILVIGTDGVSQARDASGAFFGLDQLEAELRASSGGSAEAIWRQVIDAVARFREPLPRDDDETLVVVRRRSDDNAQPDR